jgi:hypothetical protein
MRRPLASDVPAKRLLAAAVVIAGVGAALAAAQTSRGPAVTGFGLAPSTFAVAKPGSGRAAATTIRFHLSAAAATVSIAIVRERPGHRPGAKVGTVTRRHLAAGDKAVAFSGRLGRVTLAPGRYRATIVAVNRRHARGKRRTATFTVVRSAAAPRAFPTAATVGVPAGWTPAHTTNGDLTITRPGTVLEGELVTGSILVRARDVTIRSSRVYGRIDNQAFDGGGNGIDYGGLLIEDTDVGPPTGVGDVPNGAIGVSGYTARRVRIHNMPEGFRVAKFGNDAVPAADETVDIEDSLVQIERGQCSHNDGLQGFGEPARTIIRHNTIDTRAAGTDCTTAAIFVGNGNPTLVTVQDNLLLGGGYTMRLGPSGTYDHVTGNRIADDSWGFGPVTVASCSRVAEWADNTVVRIDADYGVTSTVRRLDSC